MEIRYAHPEDYEVIATIWHESASKMDGGAPVLDHPSTLVDRTINSVGGGWKLIVAVIDEDIVGLLAFIPKDRVLNQLFVAPAAQGQGVGAALLHQAKQELFAGFALHTLATNLAGHRFYERHGLVAVKDGVHAVTGASVRHFEWRP